MNGRTTCRGPPLPPDAGINVRRGHQSPEHCYLGEIFQTNLCVPLFKTIVIRNISARVYKRFWVFFLPTTAFFLFFLVYKRSVAGRTVEGIVGGERISLRAGREDGIYDASRLQCMVTCEIYLERKFQDTEYVFL